MTIHLLPLLKAYHLKEEKKVILIQVLLCKKNKAVYTSYTENGTV